jgi:hypothetical protein
MAAIRVCWYRFLPALLVCAVGSTADASCGDYLFQGTDRTQESSQTAHHDLAPGRPFAHHSSQCRGPGCRNAPEQPPRPVPTTPPVRIDTPLAATVALAAIPLAPSGSFRGERESLHPPAGHLRRIDRPPRPSV